MNLAWRPPAPRFLAGRAIHVIEHGGRDQHRAGQHIENVIGTGTRSR